MSVVTAQMGHLAGGQLPYDGGTARWPMIAASTTAHGPMTARAERYRCG